MRKILLAVPVLALAVASCSQTANFKNDAEEFIESDEVVGEVGAAIENANCEEPVDTEVGTSYTCTAQVEGVGVQTFVATITAENEYSVAIPN